MSTESSDQYMVPPGFTRLSFSIDETREILSSLNMSLDSITGGHLLKIDGNKFGYIDLRDIVVRARDEKINVIMNG